MMKKLFLSTVIVGAVAFATSVYAAKLPDLPTMEARLKEVKTGIDLTNYFSLILEYADTERCRSAIVLMFTNTIDEYIINRLKLKTAQERHSMQEYLYKLVPEFITAIFADDPWLAQEAIDEFKQFTNNA